MRNTVKVVLGALLILTGCGPALAAGDDGGTSTGTDGGTSTGANNPNAKLSYIQQKILTPSCASSSCHAGGGVSISHIDLSAGKTLAAVVNTASQDPGVTATLVVPGHPEQSFLVMKIAGNVPSADGAAMPMVGAPLTAQQVQDVVDWITNGAQDN